MPLVLLEGILTIGDWGTPDPDEDPFVGFAGVRPLFALNQAGTHYTIAPLRRDWFYPVEFDAVKQPETIRVFVVGGSTVAGRPYTVETAFSTWLELFLSHVEPEMNWEVVNCGGVSYASYRLVPIVEEIVENYEPDLLILYTGHNEFLEDRTYEHLKDLPVAITRPYEMASSLRLFNLMRCAYYRLSGATSGPVMEARSIMPAEVDALLEHQGGMEHYVRDEAWQQSVIDHFEFNLDRMCGIVNRAGVPMVVMNPAANLSGVRPFKSEHRHDITEEERAEVDGLLRQASEAFSQTQTKRAAVLYQMAIEIDPLYADTYFQFARLLDLINDHGSAYQAYVKAKDLDVCPLRMIEPMHVVLRDVVDRHGVSWLDIKQEIQKIVPSGISGNDEFLDHVHPNLAGYWFFAKQLVEHMAAMGYLVLEPGWFMKVGPAVIQPHLNSLPSEYFAEGDIRLENLRQWARGRSELEPPVPSRSRRPADAPPAAE